MHAFFLSRPRAAVMAGCLLFAAAPTPAENLLEEVLVSGYRLEPGIEAQLSVTVLDADTIDAAARLHLEELYPLVPNLNWSGEGSRARYLQLRGVGEREQYEGAPNPSVGFVVDDIDLSGVGGIAASFDLDQVEVLRGPQSARFGASALAGVVYQRSAEPTAKASSRLELTAGNDGLLAGGLALGGPLLPGLEGRVSVYRAGSDGFRDNLYLGTATNERDELTARGKLRWSGAGDWEALLSLLYADFDNGYDAFTVTNDERTWSDHPGRDAQQTTAGSLRVSGPLGRGLELVSISSAASSDILFSFDGDWGNPDFWQRYGGYVYDYRYTNPRQRDSLSQELRLLSDESGGWPGNTRWVLGLFWNRLGEDNQLSSTGIYDDRLEENFCAPCLTDRRLSSNYEADTLAVFLSTDTELDPNWSLSTGLRFEYWNASYSDTWADINYPGPPGGSSCSNFDCSPDDDLWGGHLALSRSMGEQLEVYLRVARGFKAGGFNPSLAALQGVAVLGPEFIAYRAETLTNYELGLKGAWLGGDLAVDLALFYMDRKDAQLSQSSQQVAFDPNSFVFVTYNGAANSYGLEASGRWQLNADWSLHGALGLLQSQIRNSAASSEVSPGAVGRDLAHAPGYTLNLGAAYNDENDWFGRVDVNSVDDFYYDISHNQRSQAYTTVNLRLGKRWGAWAVSAWARNLTDERYFTRGFFFGNEPPAFADTLYTRFGDPRSYGLSLEYRHGQ